MLRVQGLKAWYGEAQVLFGVDLEVKEGEAVTLVGRNGAGKTTTLKSIIGLHRSVQGQIQLNGHDLSPLPPHLRARLGLGWVPEDRGIYASLSVEENLILPPVVGPEPWSLERIYSLFPRLKERRRHPGSKLSGGEQQMLAIARVLRMGASILLLDEPTEGLAPLLVQQIGTLLSEVKAHGISVLLVEQNLRFASQVADRHYLLSQGQVVEVLDNSQIALKERELLQHLGI
ncbi:ABC transporter related protein [Allomeiothermus silvanus DSM 9946]|uniref:ABC transporter related protein n=1 Tax=Allomeiothermus silvanus (strain ATCC 700542 / DSM 9946 / NBRC 106475 / NCIMB 13440 / VI-R2) TaxID=526227 RepID=D7BBG7_ALLS1|nr:ABC transporter ATP-binding protein [Allomeiothermus silvanus]ADH64429.1 ABC transporter related protein [Allomeiothermus silvanus DSM 9946]